MLDIVLLFSLVGILVVLAANSIVVVPTFSYGAVRQFKKLTGRKLGPGIHTILPFIEDVIVETTAGVPTITDVNILPISVSVISSDNLAVVVEGSVQYHMDPKFIDVFMQLGKETLQRGIADAIKSEIGVIASKHSGDDFIRERQTIKELINQVLRRKKPVHVRATEFGWTEPVVKPEDLLKFYKEKISAIKDDTAKDPDEPEDHAKIEKRMGVNIVTFELTNVDFSAETKKALESNKQGDARIKAKLEIYGQLRAAGLSPQEAINEASVTMGQARKKVISVEGGNATPVILVQDNDSEDKDKGKGNRGGDKK